MSSQTATVTIYDQSSHGAPTTLRIAKSKTVADVIAIYQSHIGEDSKEESRRLARFISPTALLADPAATLETVAQTDYRFVARTVRRFFFQKHDQVEYTEVDFIQSADEPTSVLGWLALLNYENDALNTNGYYEASDASKYILTDVDALRPRTLYRVATIVQYKLSYPDLANKTITARYGAKLSAAALLTIHPNVSSSQFRHMRLVKGPTYTEDSVQSNVVGLEELVDGGDYYIGLLYQYTLVVPTLVSGRLNEALFTLWRLQATTPLSLMSEIWGMEGSHSGLPKLYLELDGGSISDHFGLVNQTDPDKLLYSDRDLKEGGRFIMTAVVRVPITAPGESTTEAHLVGAPTSYLYDNRSWHDQVAIYDNELGPRDVFVLEVGSGVDAKTLPMSSTMEDIAAMITDATAKMVRVPSAIKVTVRTASADGSAATTLTLPATESHLSTLLLAGRALGISREELSSQGYRLFGVGPGDIGRAMIPTDPIDADDGVVGATMEFSLEKAKILTITKDTTTIVEVYASEGATMSQVLAVIGGVPVVLRPYSASPTSPPLVPWKTVGEFLAEGDGDARMRAYPLSPSESIHLIMTLDSAVGGSKMVYPGDGGLAISTNVYAMGKDVFDEAVRAFERLFPEEIENVDVASLIAYTSGPKVLPGISEGASDVQLSALAEGIRQSLVDPQTRFVIDMTKQIRDMTAVPVVTADDVLALRSLVMVVGISRAVQMTVELPLPSTGAGSVAAPTLVTLHMPEIHGSLDLVNRLVKDPRVVDVSNPNFSVYASTDPLRKTLGPMTNFASLATRYRSTSVASAVSNGSNSSRGSPIVVNNPPLSLQLVADTLVEVTVSYTPDDSLTPIEVTLPIQLPMSMRMRDVFLYAATDPAFQLLSGAEFESAGVADWSLLEDHLMPNSDEVKARFDDVTLRRAVGVIVQDGNGNTLYNRCVSKIFRAADMAEEYRLHKSLGKDAIITFSSSSGTVLLEETGIATVQTLMTDALRSRMAQDDPYLDAVTHVVVLTVAVERQLATVTVHNLFDIGPSITLQFAKYTTYDVIARTSAVELNLVTSEARNALARSGSGVVEAQRDRRLGARSAKLLRAVKRRSPLSSTSSSGIGRRGCVTLLKSARTQLSKHDIRSGAGKTNKPRDRQATRAADAACAIGTRTSATAHPGFMHKLLGAFVHSLQCPPHHHPIRDPAASTSSQRRQRGGRYTSHVSVESRIVREDEPLTSQRARSRESKRGPVRIAASGLGLPLGLGLGLGLGPDSGDSAAAQRSRNGVLVPTFGVAISGAAGVPLLPSRTELTGNVTLFLRETTELRQFTYLRFEYPTLAGVSAIEGIYSTQTTLSECLGFDPALDKIYHDKELTTEVEDAARVQLLSVVPSETGRRTLYVVASRQVSVQVVHPGAANRVSTLNVNPHASVASVLKLAKVRGTDLTLDIVTGGESPVRVSMDDQVMFHQPEPFVFVVEYISPGSGSALLEVSYGDQVSAIVVPDNATAKHVLDAALVEFELGTSGGERYDLFKAGGTVAITGSKEIDFSQVSAFDVRIKKESTSAWMIAGAAIVVAATYLLQ